MRRAYESVCPNDLTRMFISRVASVVNLLRECLENRVSGHAKMAYICRYILYTHKHLCNFIWVNISRKRSKKNQLIRLLHFFLIYTYAFTYMYEFLFFSCATVFLSPLLHDFLFVCSFLSNINFLVTKIAGTYKCCLYQCRTPCFFRVSVTSSYFPFFTRHNLCNVSLCYFL